MKILKCHVKAETSDFRISTEFQAVMRYLLTAVTALLSILLMGCDRILLGEQTTYAAGYSARKFQGVKEGMTVDDVVWLLGAPLTQTTQEWSEVWSYVPPESEADTATTDRSVTVFNLFGEVTHLSFTEAGVVAKAWGDYLEGSFVGLSKQQVQSTLGQPSVRKLKPFEIVFHYSVAGKSGSGTYKMRQVRFDAGNKVSSVVTATYYD